MSRQWDNIFAPDQSTVEQLLETQFAELCVERPQFLGEGWDCVAYRLGEWVFRFPRRPLGVEALATECKFLPALGRKILPGRPAPQFPYPFLGTQLQTGTPLEHYAGTRRTLAVQLGAALRELHTLSIPTGLAPDPLGKLDLDKRVPQVKNSLGQVPEWIPTSSPLELKTVVCHGDLYCRHIYVDKEGCLQGLIDWGDLHAGHPAVDLACAWSVFEPKDRELFWESYGEVDSDTKNWARFRALYHALFVKDYAIHKEFDPLAAEQENALRRILA